MSVAGTDPDNCRLLSYINRQEKGNPGCLLTLNLLTTTIVAPPSTASKWQMGFNSAFKGLKGLLDVCVETGTGSLTSS
jgi:hypothetical protein